MNNNTGCSMTIESKKNVFLPVTYRCFNCSKVIKNRKEFCYNCYKQLIEKGLS